MRLIVARCEVRYSGRLNAVLPEALRLLVFKSDGSVMVHSDAGGYKPENWMTPPTVIEDTDDGLCVRKVKAEDRLDIRLVEVVSDVSHDMGEAAALQKHGVERELQELLARRAGVVRRGAAAGAAGVAGRHRAGGPDVPRLGRGMDCSGDQARGDDRRGRAAHPLPRAAALRARDAL